MRIIFLFTLDREPDYDEYVRILVVAKHVAHARRMMWNFAETSCRGGISSYVSERIGIADEDTPGGVIMYDFYGG